MGVGVGEVWGYIVPAWTLGSFVVATTGNALVQEAALYCTAFSVVPVPASLDSLSGSSATI